MGSGLSFGAWKNSVPIFVLGGCDSVPFLVFGSFYSVPIQYR